MNGERAKAPANAIGGAMAAAPLDALELEAEAGDVNAQNELGWRHFHGLAGSNNNKAVRWFLRAAGQGNAYAARMLGYCYLHGVGVAENKEEALVWFQRGADQGDAGAQVCMGTSFWIQRDYDEAARYFRLALAQDCPLSTYETAYAAHALRKVLYYRNPVLRHLVKVVRTLGYLFLLAYALTTPPSFRFTPLLFVLGVFAVAAAGVLLLPLLPWRKGFDQDDREMAAHDSPLGARDFFDFLVGVPAEDGFFLVPVVWLGSHPLAAALAAALFAVMHYPNFTWRYCVPKGILYFALILLVLPYGVWTVMACHLTIDLIAFSGRLALSRMEKA